MKSDELFITTGLFEPSLEDPFPSETDDNETLDGIIPHQVESIWDAICLNAFDSEALIGIQRHRIATDGAGITTLVGFHRCPLSCSYCLNPQCNVENGFSRWITPQTLFDELLKDDIYFRSTGGGVTFGGGEPLLQFEFIKKFKSILDGYNFIPNKAFVRNTWKIAVETSLNVPLKNLQTLQKVIEEYIIDIKDMNPEIYKRYTKTNNNQVIENLKWLTEQGLSDSLFVRVPHIPGYNTEEDIEASVHALKELGIKNIEKFQYIVQQDKDNNKYIVANGKAVCVALKQIRIDIAKSNGILYEPSICHYEGECPGTCPKCEQELNEISLQIEQK